MEIYLKLQSGKTITVEAESSDTIENIKAKVEEKEGIPPRMQKLIFAHKELKDEHTVACYSIKDKSTLDLCPEQGGGRMQVFVRALSSKTIKLKLRPLDTIRDVKAMVQNQQRLFFCGNQLEDGRTLADYHVQGESTLLLDFGMRVFVSSFTGRQTIGLVVSPSDTVDDVKERIQVHQTLVFDGKELQDGQTLADAHVKRDSTLHLDLCLHGGSANLGLFSWGKLVEKNIVALFVCLW